MSYGITRTVDMPFDDAVLRVREALAEQGFGIVTEIDFQTTLKNKIGKEIEPYLILGACNPPLAARALDADRSIGMLLPCNVVVRASGDQATVEAFDPAAIADREDMVGMREIADEVRELLTAALDSLDG